MSQVPWDFAEFWREFHCQLQMLQQRRVILNGKVFGMEEVISMAMHNGRPISIGGLPMIGLN